jgi:hypothetical protein
MVLELSKILLHLALTLAGGIVVAVIAILFIILLGAFGAWFVIQVKLKRENNSLRQT